MPSTSISNMDDYIDSRNIIARIEELESDTEECEVCKGTAMTLNEQGEETDEPCVPCDGEGTRLALDEVDALELRMLKELNEEGESATSDWTYGATLIRESYFTDYAKQFADDIGAISGDSKWPNHHIDWEAAAEELQMDYTTVEFDGVTYYVR